MGSHFLLLGIFPILERNFCLLYLLHCQADSLPLSHRGSPPLSWGLSKTSTSSPSSKDSTLPQEQRASNTQVLDSQASPSSQGCELGLSGVTGGHQCFRASGWKLTPLPDWDPSLTAPSCFWETQPQISGHFQNSSMRYYGWVLMENEHSWKILYLV